MQHSVVNLHDSVKLLVIFVYLCVTAFYTQSRCKVNTETFNTIPSGEKI